MPASTSQNPTIIVAFTPGELAQLEAFAALHGVTVAAFVQRAALEAASIAPAKKKETSADALWMSEDFASTSKSKEIPQLFATDDEAEPEIVAKAYVVTEAHFEEAQSTKRGVTGEPSKFAKGQGPVWEIRQALGRERVHSLGWTREQLAFVLKLSVVGVRKMEHMGTAPVKSLEARKSLLNLAKTLENPTPEIVTYIESEEATLS